MEWIDTDFGLYILCPASSASEWQGDEANEVAADATAKIELPGHGSAISFGEEPLPIAYHPATSTFVRWVQAENDEGLEDAITTAATQEGWEHAFDVDLDGRYVLFDSALPGAEVDDADTLRIDVPKGSYSMYSIRLNLAPDAEFILDRLVRV